MRAESPSAEVRPESPAESGPEELDKVVLILNFFEELRRIAPTPGGEGNQEPEREKGDRTV